MNNILEIYNKNNEVSKLLKAINKNEYHYYVNGCGEHHQYLLTYATYLQSGSFVVYIAPNVYKANLAYENLCKLAGHNNVNLYLADELISTELIAVSREFKSERMNTLKSIINNEKKIIVTHVLAVLKPNINKKMFIDSLINIKTGSDIDIKKLISKLVGAGYKRAAKTCQVGEFSIRGEIIDIYPNCYEKPIRISLFDTEIEKIRYFNYETQKSEKEGLDEVTLLPMNEIVIENEKKQELIDKIVLDSNSENEIVAKDMEDLNSVENIERMNKYMPYICENHESILEYIDEKLIIYDDYSRLEKAYEQINIDVNNYTEEAKFSDNLKLMFFYDLPIITNCKKQIFCSEFKMSLKGIVINDLFDFRGYDVINFDHNMKLLISEFNEKISKTIILSISDKEQRNLLKEVLVENSVKFIECNSLEEVKINKVNICLIDNAISFGIFDDVEVITESELFPNKKQTKAKYRSVYQNSVKIESKEDLTVGDYVVHYDYGIGRYLGIETIELGEYKNDYLVLQYENMPLYIPVDKITLLEKYQGSEGITPKLTRIGSKDWEKKKAIIKEKIESIAKDLIDLQVKRESQKGYKYLADNEFQKMFEDDFEFTETPDQIRIVNEIKHDMENGKVIDRLVCGDVGFGKTEIAMRIAFKTIYNGKQVAYLAPTTILTRQHYYTFKERFEKYGIRVELLNRLISLKEQEKIIKDLKAGLIDVIIGTHRILSNDVKFKDLGLLIVDEEQRFGVVHKELIKRMKANINVLTLTATPIPRTLQMAVMGVRQLSLIETPPMDRHPIQTYVLEYNDSVIREAIYRELGRGGQVFYLHNRISDLELLYRKIRKLVPEARICLGHGKMNRDELEDTIQSFIDKEYDVLLCTTIIETGIDIPNSNTLIIDEADKLGLAQLYQIRGRVGRSDKIAYAYLTYRRNKVLSAVEGKRLSAIKEYTTLGSGYKIAVRDLAIRGAGDILGKEQSGYIDSIGLDMYMKMLDNSIKKVKGIEAEDELNYNIEISKHVDKKYVEDDSIRIYIHKEISQIENEDDKKRIIEEFSDRFGKLSKEVLLYIEEKYLESLFRYFKITNVMETKNAVSVIIPNEILEKIKAEEFFLPSLEVNDKFNFEYKNRQLIIKLKKEQYDKQWIYYYSKLLTIVKNNTERKKV